MLVLSGEDLPAELWRALARTDTTAEELLELARSVRHAEGGPLSRTVTSDFGAVRRVALVFRVEQRADHLPDRVAGVRPAAVRAARW